MKKSKLFLLLGTMLKSTSSLNILKHSKDKKKKGETVGNLIGYGLIYIILIAYGAVSAYAMGKNGMGNAIPAATVISISAVSFIFTLMKSNGYLYNFKEYDMIMSMPFEAKTVVSCKFLYMYIKSLAMPYALSVSMMIGYGLSLKPKAYVYVLWLLLSLVVGIIPTAAASGLASLVAGVGSGKKIQKVLQTILIFAFVMVCMCSRFFIESIFRDSKGEEVLGQMSGAADSAKEIYLPAKWFENAIIDGNISSLLLLVGVSALFFVLYYTLIAKTYKKVNSKLSAYAGAHSKKKVSFKKKSVVRSIAQKEVSRFFSSVTYMTNVGIGQVFVVLLGVASLFVKADKLIAVVTQGAPLEASVVAPVIPFIVFFFIGMVSTTCITPSLEGKNYWILQSMPVKKHDIYKGKMLFNLYASIPFALFSVTCLSICFRVTIIEWLSFMVLETAMCLASTSFGMVMGVRHMKLEWENEIEVIKQGAAVSLYLFPNMILTMVLGAAGVFFGLQLGICPAMFILAAVYGIIALGSYCMIMKK